MKITLDEVLQEKEIVLVDGSVQSDAGDFYWYLGGIQSPKELDLDRIYLEINNLEQFNKILLRENVRTTPEVTKELTCLTRIVTNNIRHIFRRHKGSPNSEKNSYEKEREVLNQLHNAAFEVGKNSKGKEISKTEAGAFNGNLENFFSAISEMNQLMQLKKDVKEKLGIHHPKDWQDGHADEYLVAYAYCLMLNQKSCGILTSDTDIINLMGVCTKILGSDEFLPYNEKFRESVLKNNSGIYFRNNSARGPQTKVDLFSDVYEPLVDLSGMRFEKRADKRVRDTIDNLMRKLEYRAE